MIGHDFPYLDTRDLNLDWLLKSIKQLHKEMDDYDEKLKDLVSEWLFEHPEYTTTVMDNSLTIEKFTEELRTIIKGAPLNVLYIGVKNDGSEDASDIINDYTEDFNLYFPDGHYNIGKPINLKHNIIGSGYSRSNNYYNGAWIFSSIINIETNNGVFNIHDESVTIKDINIKLNSIEAGISLIDTAKYSFIENVNISNVRTFGIYAAKSGGGLASRLLYANNISIFGANDYPSISRGINLGDNVGDCKIDNAEIMGCKVGINTNNRILMLNNVHIWCGCLNGYDMEDWWSGTVGLSCSSGARVIGNNIYIDSCYYSIYTGGSGDNISINNLVVLEDDSMLGNADYDGAVFTASSIYNRIHIEGGYFTFKNVQHCSKLYFSTSIINLTLQDVCIISDRDILTENYQTYASNPTGEKTKIAYTRRIAREATKYVEIARIIKSYEGLTGTLDFYVSFSNGGAGLLRYEKTTVGGETITYINKTIASGALYWKKENDTIKVYIGLAAGGDATITVQQIYSSPFMQLADLMNIRRRTPNAAGNNEVVFDEQSDTTGLTEVA